MRLSRWGRSPYETESDIQLECDALSRFVTLVPEGADAEIVVVHSKIPMGPEQHGQAPSLRLILTTTSGTDHIDLGHFEERGIVVGRLPEARRDAVVDATIGMLVWGLRRLGPMQKAADRGEWIRSSLPALAPIGLRGARVGLVGLGVIGRAVAEVLAALGSEVWGSDPAGLPEGVQAASIEEMLGHCDAVSLHCDLNESNRGLLSAERLSVSHPDLVIVNTARGALIDVGVALSLLKEQRLGGLALDVFPEEPWGMMAQENERVMLTPHAAGFHTTLSKKIREALCAAVAAFLQDKPIPHQVYPR
jgi:lactate dehydrogenase-like 2-hydroxyacid dehydrogenase